MLIHKKDKFYIKTDSNSFGDQIIKFKVAGQIYFGTVKVKYEGEHIDNVELERLGNQLYKEYRGA